MIQQQQFQAYSFIPILQSATLEEDNLPSYEQYSYDFYNKQLKQKSLFVNMDQLSYVPYYAGVVQIQNTRNYLITGGVVFTQDNTQEAFTTNQCLQLQITEESILFQTFDPSTQEDVIPQLIYPRHNHKVFQLRENNQNVFIAVGGSFIDNQGSGVHKTCEKLVEGSKNWVEIAPLSKNRTGFSGFTLNNKIYVFGGIENPGQAKQDIIPISIVEVYDIDQNKWESIKYKNPLGVSVGLESLCIPVDNQRVLILGGSKDRSSDQILIMDVEAKSFVKHSTKLNNPKAKAYGSLLSNIQTKQIVRTENSENVVETSKNLIVTLGGNNGNQTLDVYEINVSDLSLTLISKQDLSKVLDDSYEMHGLANQNSWTQAFQSMPILTLFH